MNHAGYGDPSDTFDAGGQGTEWPEDTFTSMVNGGHAEGIERPARHSYDADGNMESYAIAGPYAAANRASADLSAFTRATGPGGRVTPEARPDVVAS